MISSNRLEIRRICADFNVSDLESPDWQGCHPVTVSHYWSGKPAPEGRHFSAAMLWSDTALYVRFDAAQNEELVVTDEPRLDSKTYGLWDRDVCELFVAPSREVANRYFEFEVAPTGEWVDVGIEVTAAQRISDFDYASHMTTAAKILAGRVVMAVKIPWSAFGKKPHAGDIWLGNIFRCVGRGDTRGYLSWQATATAIPNFHVPDKFGEFIFGGGTLGADQLFVYDEYPEPDAEQS